MTYFICTFVSKTGVEPTQEVDETSTVNHVATSSATAVENDYIRNNHQSNNHQTHATQASAKDRDIEQNEQQSSPKSMSSVKTQQVILSSRQSSTSSQLPGPSHPHPANGTSDLMRHTGSDVTVSTQLDATLSTSPPPPPVPPRPMSRANNSSTLLRSNAMSAATAARGGSRRGGGSRASRRPSNSSPTSLLGSPQRANGTLTT